MNTNLSTVRSDHGHPRTVTTARCAVCGQQQAFLDLATADHLDHRCGTPAMGGTWWVSKAAPGVRRRVRVAS